MDQTHQSGGQWCGRVAASRALKLYGALVTVRKALTAVRQGLDKVVQVIDLDTASKEFVTERNHSLSSCSSSSSTVPTCADFHHDDDDDDDDDESSHRQQAS
eukprot:6488052-Amphidinium_carterae.2